MLNPASFEFYSEKNHHSKMKPVKQVIKYVVLNARPREIIPPISPPVTPPITPPITQELENHQQKVDSLECNVNQQTIRDLENAIVEKIAENRSLEAAVIECNLDLSFMKYELERKDKLIAKLREDIRKRNGDLSELLAQAKPKDAKVVMLDETVKEKDAEICALQRHLQDSREIIREKDEIIHNLEGKLTAQVGQKRPDTDDQNASGSVVTQQEPRVKKVKTDQGEIINNLKVKSGAQVAQKRPDTDVIAVDDENASGSGVTQQEPRAKKVKTDQGNKYNCIFEGCNKKFKQKSDMDRHHLVHTGEKPFICGNCAKGFNQKCNLKKHLYTHVKK